MPLITQPTVHALAQALGHFIWQGALLGLAAHLVGRTVRPSANARYLLGVTCLAAMAAMPVATTAYLLRGATSTLAVTAVPLPAGGGRASAMPIAQVSTSASLWAPSAIVVVVWLVGVSAFSLRLLGGWVVTRRFVDRARGPVAVDLQAAVERVSARLGLSRIVEVCESPAIVGPMLIGWIKPVVIVPTAALSNLSPGQVEALLAHELAHVRRHDYLVNLLQSAVETVLFYHPAVWLVSRQVRQAREECCDDLAVAVCDRVVYVSALADLAALSAGPRLALAATDGSLVARVRRLVGTTNDDRAARPGWMPALLLVGLVALVGPVALSSAPKASALPAPAVLALSNLGRPAQTPTAATPQDEAALPAPRRATVAVDDGTPGQAPTPEELERQRMAEAQQAKALEDLAALRAERAQVDDEQTAKLRNSIGQLNAERAALLEQLAGAEPTVKLERDLKVLKHELEQAEENLRTRQGGGDELDGALELKAKQEQLGEAQAELAQLAKLREEALTQADSVKLARAAAEKAGARADAFRLKSDLLPLGAEDRAALEKARTEADEMSVEAKVKMETELARLQTMLSQKELSEEAVARLGKIQESRLDANESRPDKVLIDPATADLSFIHAVAASGSGAIVVLNQGLRRSVAWHDGLTVADALTAAGLPPADRADLTVARLSEMTVTWRPGKDTSDESKSERLEAASPLRRGDVLVVAHKDK